MAQELEDVFSSLISNPEPVPPSDDLPIDDSSNVPTPAVNSAEPSEGSEDDNVNVSGSEPITEPTASGSEPEGLDWDSFVDETTTTPADKAKPSIDWAEVGKAINIPSEVKSVDDVTKYVSELKKTVEDLKSRTISEDIPTELAEALELAKSGGDYKTYLQLNDIDYTQEDPVLLFEDEVAELFYNNDGSFREEEYQEYIDSVSEPDKKLRGKAIQKELIRIQEEQKNTIKRRALEQKADSLRKLESALNNFDKVNDYTVTPKIKKQMFDELATGQFLKELGISESGAHNWDKVLNNYFKSKYFDAIQQFNAQKALTAEKRKELKELSNSSVGRTSAPSNPTSETKKSGVDLYLDQFIRK